MEPDPWAGALLFGDRDERLLAVAKHPQERGAAGCDAAELAARFGGRLDRLTADTQDHVAGSETCAGGRAARLDVVDHCALHAAIEPQTLLHLSGDIAEREAEAARRLLRRVAVGAVVGALRGCLRFEIELVDRHAD